TSRTSRPSSRSGRAGGHEAAPLRGRATAEAGLGIIATMTENGAAAETADGGESGGMTERSRRRIAVVLVVLATLTGILALVSNWVKRQVYDTDQWVATSSALLADDEIRSELSDYLTTQIFASGVVQDEVANLLPPKAAQLAGPASSGLRTHFTTAAN